MRRHRGSSNPYTKGTSPLSETVSLIRTFNSETNPARPVRPSPLTRSTIQDMPLDMLDRIRSFPLFQSAPESFLAAIGHHLRPQSHSAHDYILTEGDEAKAMYWVVRGAVAVTSRDGESTYAELKQGAFFGEIGVLMGIPRTATIVARTKCLLVVLKREDLSKELPNFPDVEKAIREEAQERLAILERKKKENLGPLQDQSSRGEKRAYDDASGDLVMNDGNGAYKKRKSPSPGIVEAAASSALGSGFVGVRQILKELPLFSRLPSDMLHFIGSNAQQRTYPPFTDIVKQDSQGREVYFIIRGEVEVIDEKARSQESEIITNAAGRMIRSGQQVKARLRQGNYFGEVASLSLAPRRTATVRSVSSVECLLITGDVLAAFWMRCPPEIKEQVEKTAKDRLKSTSENDVIMADFSDMASISIGDRTKQRKASVPKVTVEFGNPFGNPFAGSDGSKSPGLRDRQISEPLDPDPYLNPDLNNVRSRSRRSSLAPPSPEGSSDNGEKWPSSSNSSSSNTKRAKNFVRRASSFSKGPLPDRLLLRIFSHLELHHLMRMRLISLHWSRLLKESQDLFVHLDLARYNREITDDALTNSIGPFIGNRPRSIDISNCFHVTDEGFTGLAAMCGANVVRWRMKSVWEVSAAAIHEMVKQAKELQEIDLSNCRKVNDALLMHVIGNVPLHLQQQQQSLTNAQYSGRPTFPGRGASAQQQQQQAVANGTHGANTVVGSQQLRKLTLSYCKHVTDRSMAHIGHYARTRLEEVDLTRCTTITDHGFEAWGQHQFSRLTKLCLADCTYLTDNAIVFLTNAAPGLRWLDLSFCCALSDTATEVLALGCPYLMHLNLSFCGSAVSDSSLRSIGLHLLEMRFLSVRGCVRVTGIGVEAVVEGCHRLVAYDVSQCKNLLPWFERGGLGRVRKGVRFNVVAGGWGSGLGSGLGGGGGSGSGSGSRSVSGSVSGSGSESGLVSGGR